MGEAGSCQNQSSSVLLCRLYSAQECIIKWASHIIDTADLYVYFVNFFENNRQVSCFTDIRML